MRRAERLVAIIGLALVGGGVLLVMGPWDATVAAAPPLPEDKCEIIPDVESHLPIIDCGEMRIGPFAFTPILVGPMYADGHDFTIALVDEKSPPGTLYRVTMHGDDRTVVSDWSTDQCRRFTNVREWRLYRFDAIAFNPRSRFMSEPESYWWYIGGPRSNPTPPDDPWLSARMDEVVEIYSLTEKARRMLEAIPLQVYPNEPGHAGYGGPVHGVGVGEATHPWTFGHEYMHAFWENWDGFPERCDKMNVWTFRRDLARWVLQFFIHDRAPGPNPQEAWRPYYNNVTADFKWWSNPWEILLDAYRDDGHFGADIWNLMYHIADTDPPMMMFGQPHLLPPVLQPYFDGFIEPVKATSTTPGFPNQYATSTLATLLDDYVALEPRDRRLTDEMSPFFSRLIVGYTSSDRRGRTSIVEPLRTTMRNADRQALVDFINTLEQQACNPDCVPWWEADPAFWWRYSVVNLTRWTLYRREIGPRTGIELPDLNWSAMRQSLSRLPVCDSEEAAIARSFINEQDAISEAQRGALLAVLSISEDALWLCTLGLNAAGRSLDDWAPPQLPKESPHCFGLRPEPPVGQGAPQCGDR